MEIILSPIRDDRDLSIERIGDIIRINGKSFDFSGIPDGATLPEDAIESDWFVGPVERIDGRLRITLLFPHSSESSEAIRFPEPIIGPADGVVELPK